MYAVYAKVLKDAGAEIFDFTCLEMRLGWIGVRDTSLDAGAIVKKKHQDDDGNRG